MSDGDAHAAIGVLPPPERRFRPRYGALAAVNQSLAVLPVLITALLFGEYASMHQLAVDFHNDFWVAGARVAHGLSPYDWTRGQISSLVSFPYPAPAALLFVPVSLLSRAVGDVTFVVLCIVACLSALRILGVRDWRLYALVLLWWPVINGWQTANVTLLLLCGLAAVWRYRNQSTIVAMVLAAMLCMKPVVWPVVLWLVITRRYRAATYGVALALVLASVSWAVLGFGQLPAWWQLLGRQMAVMYSHGYGLVALAARFGIGRTLGTALQLAIVAVLVGVCLSAKRERVAFTVAIVLIITSSPLVDNHYFALLIAPLAIARPKLDRAWLAPLAFWLCPATGLAVWQLVLAWVVLAVVAVSITRSDDHGRAAWAETSAVPAIS